MSAFSKFKLCFMAAMMCAEGHTHAEVSATPDLSAWISAWKKSTANPDIPKSIAIVDRWQNEGTNKSSPHFGPLEPELCDAWSYLRCEGHASLNLAVAINTATPSPFNDIKGLRKLVQPDIFILPTGKSWQLRLNGEKQPMPFQWKPLSDSEYVKSLTEAVIKSFGYDGIILAQNGNFLLVGSTTEMLEKEDLQGLILGGSEKSSTITDKSFSGSALITKLSHIQGFGLFSLMAAASSKDIAPGTKVILEKKRVAKARKEIPKADPTPAAPASAL